MRQVGAILGLCAALGSSAGCAEQGEFAGFANVLGHSRSAGAEGLAAETTDAALALNHVQLKGSHNSYHQAPRMAITKAWRYSHLPLEQQLELQGVRQIELDVRYSGGEVVVGHLPVLDGRSSCRTLKQCLTQIRRWSVEHPAHLPIFVFIEPKEHVSPSNLQGRIEVLDNTITSVFPRKSLIVPEDVAGSARSLQEAVQTRGWPTLESARGKVMFVLFGRENHTRAYGRNRPRLDGRVMFAAGTPQDPYAAVASYDDPVAMQQQIRDAVGRGMLVRTRADGDLRKDERRRDAALDSGAHFIGSDFVDPKHGWLDIGPRTPARCNPLSDQPNCIAAALREEREEAVVAVEHGAETQAARRLDQTPAAHAPALHQGALGEAALPTNTVVQ